VGVIDCDIRIFCQLNFSLFKCVFRPQSYNKIAHALAALRASGHQSCCLWHEVVQYQTLKVLVVVTSDSTVPMN
jgi:hypothetical protein